MASTPINIMNKCGYDFTILGNHEFDYELTQFNTLNKLSNTQYLSWNFTDLRTEKPMFDAYTLHEYANPTGRGRIAIKDGPDPELESTTDPAVGSGGKPLASTGDTTGFAAIGAAAVAAAAGGSSQVCGARHPLPGGARSA